MPDKPDVTFRFASWHNDDANRGFPCNVPLNVDLVVAVNLRGPLEQSRL